MFRILMFIFMSFSLCHCGVKGRPLPPENPREIGIGRPQYEGLDMELKNSDKEKQKKEKNQ